MARWASVIRNSTTSPSSKGGRGCCCWVEVVEPAVVVVEEEGVVYKAEVVEAAGLGLASEGRRQLYT